MTPARARRWLRLPTAPLIALLALSCAAFRRDDSEELRYRRVMPTIAFEMLHDSPTVFILDLRERAEFEAGHLNGATSIPLAELAERLNELNAVRELTFLVYCRPGPCEEEGMHLLVASGFEDAILMVGGVERWLAAGYGVVAAGKDLKRD